jgi:hypothetical protein
LLSDIIIIIITIITTTNHHHHDHHHCHHLHQVRAYAVHCMEKLSDTDLALYMLQVMGWDAMDG